jgi:DNA-binding response OmpR family regulator
MEGDGSFGKWAVLVVEDNFLLAETVCDALADFGLAPVGPAPTIDKALGLIGSQRVDLALLDIKVGKQPVFPICEVLNARGIPFVFLSGTVEELPVAYASAPMVGKPARPDIIAKLILSILRARRDPGREGRGRAAPA